MTDPVPSKERDIEQMESLAGVANGTRDPRDYEIRKLADFAITRIESLHTALRGIQSCSTCEACRGAATLALGGATPEPAAERSNRREIAGMVCAHGVSSSDNCAECHRAAQPPGDGQ